MTSSSDFQGPPSFVRPYPLTLNILPTEVRSIIYESLIPAVSIWHDERLAAQDTTVHLHDTYRISPPRDLLDTLLFQLGKQPHEDTMQAMSRARVYVSGVPRHLFNPHNYSFPPFIFANVQRLCSKLFWIDGLFEQQDYDVSIFPKLKTVWASRVAPAEAQVNLIYPGDLLSYIAECLHDDQGPERLGLSGRLFSKFQHFIDTQADRQGYPTQSF